jgi:Ser/Thr protein kinase RdoA (MazF antagonist)
LTGPGVGYADLSPQQVLDTLDAIGFRGDGRILQLNSYENRVFQVFLEDGQAVVAKFYRPGRWSDAQILEEHAFALELAAAEVPVVPPLPLPAAAGGPVLQLQPAASPTLATLRRDGAPHRVTVAARCAGRAPELEAPQVLRRLGRFIGRLHDVGRRRDFEHRHVIRPGIDARAAQYRLLDGGFVPATEAGAWRAISDAAVTAIDAAFGSHADLVTLRLHGDCHLGNVLWRDEGPHVVDLDDACMGPAVQDLWMLVAGDASTAAAQWRELLTGYEEFMDFDDRERALIEPLRTLRMLRHSAWLADRWTDPAFPAAFPFFGSSAYWSEQIAQLREQVELMAA